MSKRKDLLHDQIFVQAAYDFFGSAAEMFNDETLATLEFAFSNSNYILQFQRPSIHDTWQLLSVYEAKEPASDDV